MEENAASPKESTGDHRKHGINTLTDSELADLDCKKRQKLTSLQEYDIGILLQRSRNFGKSHEMGVGVSGTVYYIEINDGEPVAARGLAERNTPLSRDNFLKQVSNIARLEHDNVVKLLGFSSVDNEEPPVRILVYEFARYFSLYDNLHGTYEGALVLDWDQRLRIVMDAARGLEYLHGESVAYQDLKSRNVLIFDGLRAKIADINLWYRNPDLSNIYADSSRHTYDDGCSSYDYCYHVNDFDQKSDVYSFGVLLMEILTGMKDREKDCPCILARAAPNLGKLKLPRILDPKLGKLENYQLKAAAKLAALAAYCILPPPYLRPDMGFVIHILEFILDNPDGVEIEKRIAVLETMIGEKNFTNHVVDKVQFILELEQDWCFPPTVDSLYFELDELTLDPSKEMLKAEIWLLKY